MICNVRLKRDIVHLQSFHSLHRLFTRTICSMYVSKEFRFWHGVSTQTICSVCVSIQFHFLCKLFTKTIGAVHVSIQLYFLDFMVDLFCAISLIYVDYSLGWFILCIFLLYNCSYYVDYSHERFILCVCFPCNSQSFWAEEKMFTLSINNLPRNTTRKTCHLLPNKAATTASFNGMITPVIKTLVWEFPGYPIAMRCFSKRWNHFRFCAKREPIWRGDVSPNGSIAVQSLLLKVCVYFWQHLTPDPFQLIARVQKV